MLKSISNLAENIIKKYQEYKLKRKTLAELAVLSDRELHDIGINPCDVPGRKRNQYPLHFHRFNKMYPDL